MIKRSKRVKFEDGIQKVYCTGCDDWKPYTEFDKCVRSPHGYSYYCKNCMAGMRKKSAEKAKERTKRRMEAEEFKEKRKQKEKDRSRKEQQHIKPHAESRIEAIKTADGLDDFIHVRTFNAWLAEAVKRFDRELRVEKERDEAVKEKEQFEERCKRLEEQIRQQENYIRRLTTKVPFPKAPQ